MSRKAAELHPAAAAGRRFQVLVAVQRGDGEAALREAQMEPDENYRRFELALAQYARKERAAADAALADLIANRQGVAYQIAVTAEGFSDWNSSITVEPGQDKTLSEVKLRILAVQRAVTVSYSSKEVAAQQLKAEEQQRVLGFIPNVYVVYDPHPEPLTTRMKFQLAYKDLTHPVFFARTAAWAGVEQAAGLRNYPQNARGYGERLGTGLADGVTEGLIGNAILPSLLHQDPRYFYQGSGTKKSRALHSMLAAFICKGDNGAWQPNYSTWGGSLISSSISLAYYPSSDRNARHVFGNFGIGMGLHVAAGLAQEFILSKFTSRGKQ